MNDNQLNCLKNTQKLLLLMKTSSTKEQQILNLQKRIKELNVFLKKETKSSEIKRIMNELIKIKKQIQILKKTTN